MSAILNLPHASAEVKALVRAVKLTTSPVPGTRAIRDKMKQQIAAATVFHATWNFWMCTSPDTKKGILVQRLYREESGTAAGAVPPSRSTGDNR